MARTTKDSTDKTARGNAASRETSAARERDSAMIPGQPLAKAWGEIMQESTRFVAGRLQKDLEAQQALLRCTTPAEVAKLQSDVFQLAMRDYTDEARRMVAILSGAADDAMDEAKTGQSRDYDDFPV